LRERERKGPLTSVSWFWCFAAAAGFLDTISSHRQIHLDMDTLSSAREGHVLTPGDAFVVKQASASIRKHLKYLVEAFFRTIPSYAFELKYTFPDDAEKPIIQVRPSTAPGGGTEARNGLIVKHKLLWYHAVLSRRSCAPHL
jgi:hypothetical protein